MNPPIDPALAARTELATPLRYHLAAQPPPREAWWLHGLEAVERFLARLFAHVHGGGSVAAALSWVLLALVLGLILYLLVRLLPAVPRPSSAVTSIEALSAERSDARLARQAFAAAERGELTTAVRLLLRAAVVQLNLRGAIEDEASATIGDLRREVMPLGERITVPFDTIASAYVGGVYAQRPVEPVTWNRARVAYEALRGSLKSSRG